MHCIVCFSEEFREDEQGFYFCVHCGTQSQDFFAESFENEEAPTGPVRSRRIKVRTPGKVTGRSDPDILSYLSLMQDTLKLFTMRVARFIGNRDLMRTTRVVWFAYLKAWHSSGELIFDTQRVGNLRHYISERTQWVAVMPSKVLLLACVYLALRLLRSWVLPADLVKFSLRGIIPFVNVLDHLAQTGATAALLARFPTISKMLNRESTGRLHRLLTPGNIYFHTCMLAGVIGAPLPPLNVPLAAATSILSLGLPARDVWENLTRMCRVLRLDRPHSSLSCTGRHHMEHILSLIVIACKLTPHWMEWTLEHLDGGRTGVDDSHSFHFAQQGDILRSRADLPSFLEGIQAVTKEVSVHSAHGQRQRCYRGHFAFNKAMRKICDSVRTVNSGSSLNISDELVRSSAALIGRQCAKHNPISTVRADVGGRRGGNSSGGDGVRRYLTYCCGDGEEPDEGAGYFHPQYIFLIERVARFGCCHPGLLHTLVNGVDMCIVNGAAAPVGPNITHNPLFGTDMSAHMHYYDEVLPAVQSFSWQRELAGAEMSQSSLGSTQQSLPRERHRRKRPGSQTNKLDIAHSKQRKTDTDKGIPFAIQEI